MEFLLIGQSTVLITLDDGIRILTDPWFESFSILRVIPVTIGVKEIRSCDLVLISHNHIDHIDRAGLGLARNLSSKVLGSERSIRRAIRCGLTDVYSMKRGDVFQFKGITIFAVEASHPFARDAIGFVIKGRYTVYFSGDTRYTKNLIEDVKRFDIDIALVQIACSWYPFWGYDGMNLKTAAQFVEEIKPKVAIPIHYHIRTKAADPEEFVRMLSGKRVVVLKEGVAQKVSV